MLILCLETMVGHVLVTLSENQKHTIMKMELYSILVATQLIGAGFAVAQTNTNSPPNQQQSATQVDISSVAAVSIASTNPAIAVSPGLASPRYEATSPYQTGQYDREADVAKKALDLAAQGTNQMSVAKCLNRLGELYVLQGKHAEAQPLFQRSLEISEKALGTNHVDVAEVLYLRAWSYQLQKQYAQAEALYQRVLQIYDKAPGTNLPRLAMTLNNLAALYRERNQYAKAEPLYRRSLAILVKVHGPNDPDVAVAESNLGRLYHDWGKHAQAVPLLEHSLPILEKKYGLNHPKVNTIREYLIATRSAPAQTNTNTPMKQQQSGIQVNNSPGATQSSGKTNPIIAVSTNTLAVAAILAGTTKAQSSAESAAKAPQTPPPLQDLANEGNATRPATPSPLPGL